MNIEKTARGVFALEERNKMAPKERQLLILSNGKRSLQDLVDIFGSDCLALLEKLQADGLLRGVQRAMPKASSASAPIRNDLPAGPKRAKNRSLAACKIYVMDVLQLQQNEGARHIVQSLRESDDAKHILELLLVALDLILERSGERYVERVANRVFEIVPDEHLNLFIRLTFELHIPILDLVARQYVGLLEAV
ncbi:hypothetical protein E9531_13980 [Lampropedia puyangensis]|uniref:Uncharacterized protein n=1 Tax=Lampropedia puyangensis TaxID=1330072 RepID=A0A4S8EW01_9BURK|nr:hypothetical protein [Lampropedia puyangensis]THT98678.1 hypothetical protein E9531_13980 [Lampropedia puyangensis]